MLGNSNIMRRRGNVWGEQNLNRKNGLFRRKACHESSALEVHLGAGRSECQSPQHLVGEVIDKPPVDQVQSGDMPRVKILNVSSEIMSEIRFVAQVSAGHLSYCSIGGLL